MVTEYLTLHHTTTWLPVTTVSQYHCRTSRPEKVCNARLCQTCTVTVCMFVCLFICVCVFMVEQASQGIIQDHTYGHLNHHTHPPIPHPPTSDTVYSKLTNTHEATPSNGGHEYAILDEKTRQDCTSQSCQLNTNTPSLACTM